MTVLADTKDERNSNSHGGRQKHTASKFTTFTNLNMCVGWSPTRGHTTPVLRASCNISTASCAIIPDTRGVLDVTSNKDTTEVASILWKSELMKLTLKSDKKQAN